MTIVTPTQRVLQAQGKTLMEGILDEEVDGGEGGIRKLNEDQIQRLHGSDATSPGGVTGASGSGRVSVLLGISGSVASVKAPDLIGALLRTGKVRSVDVVCTEPATHFVGKCTYNGNSVKESLGKIAGVGAVQDLLSLGKSEGQKLNLTSDSEDTNKVSFFSDAAEWA